MSISRLWRSAHRPGIGVVVVIGAAIAARCFSRQLAAGVVGVALLDLVRVASSHARVAGARRHPAVCDRPLAIWVRLLGGRRARGPERRGDRRLRSSYCASRCRPGCFPPRPGVAPARLVVWLPAGDPVRGPGWSAIPRRCCRRLRRLSSRSPRRCCAAGIAPTLRHSSQAARLLLRSALVLPSLVLYPSLVDAAPRPAATDRTRYAPEVVNQRQDVRLDCRRRCERSIASRPSPIWCGRAIRRDGPPPSDAAFSSGRRPGCRPSA